MGVSVGRLWLVVGEDEMMMTMTMTITMTMRTRNNVRMMRFLGGSECVCEKFLSFFVGGMNLLNYGSFSSFR